MRRRNPPAALVAIALVVPVVMAIVVLVVMVTVVFAVVAMVKAEAVADNCYSIII